MENTLSDSVMEATVPSAFILTPSSSDVRSAESIEENISGQIRSLDASAEPANHPNPMLSTSNPAPLAESVESIHPAQSTSIAEAESADHEISPSVMGPLTFAKHIKVLQLQIQHNFQEL